MPYKIKEARRQQFPKARHQVKNGREYDQAWQNRGSLTVWVTPEAIAAWQAPATGRRGRRSRYYSDLAIETGPLLRLAFALQNNRIEQDHRGIKQRYYPMLGFQSF
jgi:hypothetical protein